MASGLKVGELYGELSLERKPFNTGLDQAHAEFARFGSELLGRAGELATGLGLAIGGVELARKFIEMGQAAAGFQQQMVKLVGTAGESEKALGGVSDGVLQMAGQVGYGARELADGLYLVESAGFHGADGLNVLRESAMAAKAENADLPVVANAVTTALNAYGMAADQASHVTDVLLTATSQGKMTFQDLAGSLDQVLPSAAAAKIGLNEVAAAIATETAQGTPAAVAATNVAYAIRGLEVPSVTAQKAIEELGVKSNTFANDLQTKGLLGTLTDLTDDVGKKFPEGSAAYNASIAKILGNQEGLNAVLMLSGAHAQTFTDNLAGMNAAAGKTQSAFDEMMATTGGKWSAFMSGLESEEIRWGTRMLPLANVGLDAMTGAFQAAVPKIDAALDQASGAIKGWISDVQGQFATFERTSGLSSLAADLQFIWSETHPTPAPTPPPSPGTRRAGTQQLVFGATPAPATPDASAGASQAGSLFAQRIGDSIGAAAPQIGSATVGALKKAIGSIDWYDIGTQAAPAFEGFAIAFVSTAMNPDLWVQAIQQHPLQGLIGVLSIATIIFGPEELIGVRLVGFLGRIPIVGPILAWAVTTVRALFGPLRRLGGEAGLTFIEALGRALGKPDVIVDLERLFGQILDGTKGFFDGFGIRILEFMGRIGELLGTALRNLIDGFWRNFRMLWEGVGGENLPAFLNEFKVFGQEVVDALTSSGAKLISGFRDAMVGGWSAVSSWLGGLAGRALSALGDLSKTLLSAGQSLMQGFLDGLKSKWGDVQSFVGGVSDWISQHKGPIEVDRQLLVPHGQAIMAGLNEGILRGWTGVQGSVAGITASIAAQRLPMPAAAAAGGRDVHVTQNFYGQTADHRQMFQDAAWAARSRLKNPIG